MLRTLGARPPRASFVNATVGGQQPRVTGWGWGPITHTGQRYARFPCPSNRWSRGLEAVRTFFEFQRAVIRPFDQGVQMPRTIQERS